MQCRGKSLNMSNDSKSKELERKEVPPTDPVDPCSRM